MVVDATGRIVVVGEVVSGLFSNYDFALVRYNADGSLDTTFGGGGIIVTSFGPGDEGGDSVILDGSGLLVAGSADVAGTRDFALARYHGDGSLDMTYDGDGNYFTRGLRLRRRLEHRLRRIRPGGGWRATLQW